MINPMGDKVKVLFTGGGGVGNEALWRMLEQRYELHFGDADCSGIDPSIPLDRRHALPWASAPHFVDEVAAICGRLEVDLLIPGVDEELSVLAHAGSVLSPTLLMLPDAEYVDVMLDKLCTANKLAEKGIPVPETHSLAGGFDGVSFPCVVKPRRGRGSRGVRTVKAHEVSEVLRSVGNSKCDYVVQQKIVGTEYTVQMIADQQSRLIAIVPVRVDLKRGITIQAEVVAEPRVIAACHAIHDAIPTTGCYNIQLMLTADGKVMPFEINPRISTTFCLAVASDIDPIAAFLGVRPTTNELLPFVPGMHLRRHWVNHFHR